MPRKKAPAAEAPRLVAYYRYSGGSRQTEQSIEGQRRDCEAYARAHGMTILREYNIISSTVPASSKSDLIGV